MKTNYKGLKSAHEYITKLYIEEKNINLKLKVAMVIEAIAFITILLITMLDK